METNALDLKEAAAEIVSALHDLAPELDDTSEPEGWVFNTMLWSTDRLTDAVRGRVDLPIVEAERSTLHGAVATLLVLPVGQREPRLVRRVERGVRLLEAMVACAHSG